MGTAIAMTTRSTLLVIPFLYYAAAHAALVCPPMPAAITEVSRDVSFDLKASVGSLGKVKVGDIGVKTETLAKSLFSKYPNVDRLYTVNLLSSTYCHLLQESKSISDEQRVRRWEKFQEGILNINQPAQPKRSNGGPRQPVRAEVPSNARDERVTSVIHGSGNTVIQGSNNTIISTVPNKGSGPLQVVKKNLPTSSPQHSVEYFGLAANMPAYSVERINAEIQKYVKGLYAKHRKYEVVSIEVSPTFYEFGLLGVDISITLEGVGKEFPFDRSIGMQNLMFLLYMASAHPLQKSDSIVFSLETGVPFEFKDLFRSGYKDKVNKVAEDVLREGEIYFNCEDAENQKRAAGVAETFDTKKLAEYLGYEPLNCFSSVTDTSRFHLTGTAVVLRYSRYEIAPGYAGAVSVTLPYEKLASVINPNGPLGRIR